MLLTIYHQNFGGLKHNIDALTCMLMAKELHPYFIGIMNGTPFNRTETFIN